MAGKMASLEIHVFENWKYKTYHQCPVCDQIFTGTSLSGFDQHSVTHAEEEFSKESEPEVITKRKFGDYRTFACIICDKSFDNRSSLRRHSAEHAKQRSTNTAEVHCNICGCPFKDHKILRNHRKNVHPGDKPFKCDVCADVFATAKASQCHKRTHLERNFLIKCDVCGKGSKNRYEMLQHKKIHLKPTRYKCDVCDMILQTKKELLKHNKSHKKKVVPPRPVHYKCDVCNMILQTKKEFVKHSNSHKKKVEKPQKYVCNVCGKVIKSSSYFKTHMTDHEGIMNFQCDECGKALTCARKLREHIRNTHREPNVRRKRASKSTKVLKQEATSGMNIPAEDTIVTINIIECGPPVAVNILEEDSFLNMNL